MPAVAQSTVRVLSLTSSLHVAGCLSAVGALISVGADFGEGLLIASLACRLHDHGVSVDDSGGYSNAKWFSC